MTPLEEWEQGQRALNESGVFQNYHGPDGLTSCGMGCCDPFPRGARIVDPEATVQLERPVPSPGATGYELEFEYDTENEVGIWVCTQFKGTYEQMTAWVASHGLVKYIRARLI